MSDHQHVAIHYDNGGLLAAIEAGAAALGKTPDSISVDDLGPVDEFHIGGRQASEDLLSQLALSAQQEVLDIGCGLGGSARFVASRYGSRVTGIDLTAEFVATGNMLCRWVGLADRVTLDHGSALDLPYAEDSFDTGYMLHVGMNIADKAALMAAVYRVLRPGGVFAIYDIMRNGGGDVTFPMPWASDAGISALAPPDDYKRAFEAVGFEIVAERNRHDFAVAFFERLRARMAAAGGPPPLGLHLVMGENAAVKLGNMIDGVVAGCIAPVEIIARKAG